MQVHILTQADFDEAIASGKVIVDFWAEWCGPCRMQGPIIDEFAAENPEIKVCKLNVDEEAAIAAKYGVVSIPTIIGFNDGKQVGKAVGVQTKEQLAGLLG